MKAAPDRYVVIGNPIAHSRSPEIHARFAAQTGQDVVYERQLAPLDGFARIVEELIHSGCRGANVTVPFKLEAFAIASEPSVRARAAGAINTLKFENGVILGDNTDGVGLVTDIVRNAALPLAGKRILLLGAGGAARGVMLPLLQQKPARLVVANRTPEKAAELARRFAAEGEVHACGFDELAECFDVVVNATAASLASELPPVPAAAFGASSFAYDMMYAKQPTVFMCFAAAQGAQVRDGLGMLVEQAAESFFLWRGVRPDTAPVLAALRASL